MWCVFLSVDCHHLCLFHHSTHHQKGNKKLISYLVTKNNKSVDWSPFYCQKPYILLQKQLASHSMNFDLMICYFQQILYYYQYNLSFTLFSCPIMGISATINHNSQVMYKIRGLVERHALRTICFNFQLMCKTSLSPYLPRSPKPSSSAWDPRFSLFLTELSESTFPVHGSRIIMTHLGRP